MNAKRFSLSRRLLSILLLTTLLLPALPPPLRAAPLPDPTTPTDTPTNVVTETFNEWTIGNGMLYWAYRCFGGEFVSDGYLRRKPLNGGTQRTLSEVTESYCVTFLNMTADAEGLYYYSSDGFNGTIAPGIHFRASGSPEDPPTLITALTFDQSPLSGSRLALSATHVYWITGGQKIFRIARDGSGAIQTVANTGSSPTDLMVVGNVVYWIDSTGLWKTDTASCSTLPCAKTRLEITSGDDLIFRRDGFILSYQIYWVEYGAPQEIKRRSCTITLIIGGGTDESCSTRTLYSASTDHDWQIGRPATDGSNLFWKESYLEFGGTADSRLRRLDLTAPLTAQPEDIAVNLAIGSGPAELYNGYVYFGDSNSNTPAIKKLPWNAAPIVRDLTAVAMEVTQGIQSLNNDVPLIANKTTHVRAYWGQNSGPNAVAVAAQLVGVRGSTPLPGSPLNSINGTQASTSGGSFDRAQTDDGWLFQLPNSWTNDGSISLQLVVDPQQSYSDPNRTNNTLSRAVSFQGKAPICTVFIPVRTHAPKATTDLASFWPMVNLAQQMLPTAEIRAYKQNSDIAETQVCWWGPFPYPCFGPYELPDDDWKIMASLWIRDQFSDDPDSCDDVGATTHYVGLIHPSTFTDGLNGKGALPGDQLMIHMPALSDVPLNWRTFSPGETRSARAASFPHELGHNYNRKHIACGSPADPDNNYPYTNPDRCRIDDGPLTAAGTHYAWDVKRLVPTAPNGTTDLMSYGRPRWPSDYTWKAIMNRLNSTLVAAESDVQTAGVEAALDSFAAADGVVLLTGAYTPTNVVADGGQINYAYLFPKAVASSGQLQKWQQSLMKAYGDQGLESAAAADTVVFQLLDGEGTVLAEQPATILELADDENTQVATAATIPEPTGSVATVQLVVNGIVVAARTPGTAMPTITLSQPAGGETVDATLTVAWSADDADEEDRLLYAIQYSPDGGANWRTISSDIAGPGNSNGENTVPVTVQFNASDLPSSNGQNGLVRVLASDGYHTAIATSQPFTVVPRAPESYIVTPHEGATVAVDQPLVLEGGAFDAEDGSVDSANLAWTVDGAAVGTGNQQIVTGFAPGEHTIQLTATDSDGQSTTVERTVTILPLELKSGGTPTLDGFCDDDAYAAGTELALMPYGNGSQATVHLLRSGSYLYSCFQNMPLGATNPGAFAGVRIDKNNSRNAQAQSDDYGFFVGEDGGQFTYAGDGAGGMAAAGPGGLVAQISTGAATWAAELRIDAPAVLDGWDHPVSLNLGHYWVNSQGDDYIWPRNTVWNAPNTWATTGLGSTPEITALTPSTMTAGSSAVTLVISGTNFAAGSVIELDGTALATTIESSTVATATVPSAQSTTPRSATVTVRTSGGLVSAPMLLPIEAPDPTVTAVGPEAVQAGAGTTNVTVTGSGFLNGATVLWNGEALPTTFNNSGQLTVQVDATRLAIGGTAGIAVRNPDVDGTTSNSVPLTITPSAAAGGSFEIYLPVVTR